MAPENRIETAEVNLQAIVDQLNAEGKEARIVRFMEKDGIASQLKEGESLVPGAEKMAYHDDMKDADIGERSVTTWEAVVVKE